MAVGGCLLHFRLAVLDNLKLHLHPHPKRTQQIRVNSFGEIVRKKKLLTMCLQRCPALQAQAKLEEWTNLLRCRATFDLVWRVSERS